MGQIRYIDKDGNRVIKEIQDGVIHPAHPTRPSKFSFKLDYRLAFKRNGVFVYPQVKG